jgi:hypothetical protein
VCGAFCTCRGVYLSGTQILNVLKTGTFSEHLYLNIFEFSFFFIIFLPLAFLSPWDWLFWMHIIRTISRKSTQTDRGCMLHESEVATSCNITVIRVIRVIRESSPSRTIPIIICHHLSHTQRMTICDVGTCRPFF